MASIIEPSPGPSSCESKTDKRPIKRKSEACDHEYEFPSISSGWQKSSSSLWEYFGVELNPDLAVQSPGKLVGEFIGLVDQAAENSKFPLCVPRTSTMGIQMLTIMNALEVKTKSKKDWFDMTNKERIEIRRLIDETHDGTFSNVQQKAWDVIETIASRLHDLSDPSASRMKKDPKSPVGEDTHSESDYEYLTSGILERFFKVKRQEVQSAHFHTADNSEVVSCDPNLLCTGEIKLDDESYFRGHISLVVEVKQKEVWNKNVEHAVLRGCHGTVNQHFGQLLICMRDSLFSRNWSLFKQAKIPEAHIYAVFGAMVHGTKFQLTCLQASAGHLSKIGRRPHKARFSKVVVIATDEESEDEECEPGKSEKPGTSKKYEILKEKISSEEGSSSPSPVRESEQDAIFHVSRPVDIAKLFLFKDDFSDFMQMVDFLAALSNIANFRQGTNKKIKRKIKKTVKN